jgi:transposase
VRSGEPNAQIARTVGVSRPTVIGWRDRYVQGGIAALEDEPRPGRSAVIDEVDVVVATLANEGRPPQVVVFAADRSVAAETCGAESAREPLAPLRNLP